MLWVKEIVFELKIIPDFHFIHALLQTMRNRCIYEYCNPVSFINCSNLSTRLTLVFCNSDLRAMTKPFLDVIIGFDIDSTTISLHIGTTHIFFWEPQASQFIHIVTINCSWFDFFSTQQAIVNIGYHVLYIAFYRYFQRYFAIIIDRYFYIDITFSFRPLV